MHKKITWHKIANSLAEIDFSANNLIGIDLLGMHFCLAKTGPELKACASKCPHASGSLIEGYIDPAGNIVCPVHGYKFSLDNGRNVSGEGYHLKTYPVEIREDGVYLGIHEGGLLKWLR